MQRSRCVMRYIIRRIFSISLTLALCFAMCAAAFAAPSIHKNNVRTASHAVISGVPVMIVPPRGTVPAQTFRGFEDAARGIRIQAVLVSQPYSSAINDPEIFAKDGITVTKKIEAMINGQPATLYDGKTDDDEISAQVLVMSHDDSSIFIYGFCRRADAGAVSSVKDSLLSVYGSTVKDSNPSKQPDGYKLSTAGTTLALASEANYTRTYRDGEVATLSVTQNFVQELPTDRKQFAIDELKRIMSSIEYEITSTKNVTIGGLPGVEVSATFVGHMRRARTANGGRVNRPVLGTAYVAALFDQLGPQPRTFVFVGRSIDEADKYSAMFKRVVSTFSIVRQR